MEIENIRKSLTKLFETIDFNNILGDYFSNVGVYNYTVGVMDKFIELRVRYFKETDTVAISTNFKLNQKCSLFDGVIYRDLDDHDLVDTIINQLLEVKKYEHLVYEIV